MDESFRRAPIFGLLAKFNDALFLPRGSTDEQKQKSLNMILERQSQAARGECGRIFIYPEGFTTNGTSILQFKKGAFQQNTKIVPFVSNWKNSVVHGAYDSIELLPLAILMCSWFCA